MDFEVRSKIISDQLEGKWELDMFWEELLSECRREIECLLSERADMELDAYGIQDSGLITNIFYYNRMLDRMIDELQDFLKVVYIMSTEQALYLLNRWTGWNQS